MFTTMWPFTVVPRLRAVLSLLSLFLISRRYFPQLTLVYRVLLTRFRALTKYYFLKWHPKITKFDDLPIEILQETFKHLNTKDLLNVRMVCHKTYSVSKIRQLWYNLVQQQQNIPGTSPAEAPFSVYSDAELEEWVIRRARIQNLWENPERIQIRTRLIDVDMKISWQNQGRLLPGGRWFLVRDKGKVYAIDLEEPDKPVPRLLVDAGEFDEQTGLRDSLDYWTIWESPNWPSSPIRLVLYRRDPSLSAPHSRFCIYEVKSEGHGSNACLIATPITMLRHLLRYCVEVGLNDEYMVHVAGINIFKEKTEPRRLTIFKYTASNKSCEPLSVLVTTSDIADVSILGENLLFVGAKNLDVYSLTQLSFANSQRCNPLHRIDSYHYRVSNSIPCNQSEVMTCLSLSSIRRVSLVDDDDGNSSLQVQHISDLPHYVIPPKRYIGFGPPHSVNIPGHSHSMIILDDFTVDILNHSWDPTIEKFSFSRHNIAFPNPYNSLEINVPLGFCEELGRTAILGPVFPTQEDSSWKLLIIELS